MMNSKGPSNMRYKTMMCKRYNSNEGCQYGDKCQFAHGVTDLRTQNIQMGIDNESKVMQQQKSIQNYKIVKCKNFEKDGQCKYGSHCTFAHGDVELRNKNDQAMGMGMGMGGAPQQNPMMMYQPSMYDYMMMNQVPMANMQGMGQFPQMPMEYPPGIDPNMYMMMNMPQDMNMNNMNLNNPMSTMINPNIDQEQQNQEPFIVKISLNRPQINPL